MIKKAEIDDVKDIMYLSSLIKDNKVTETYFLNKIEDDNYLLLIEKKDDKVVGIELSRNFGQMKAILAGLEHSTRRVDCSNGLRFTR